MDVKTTSQLQFNQPFNQLIYQLIIQSFIRSINHQLIIQSINQSITNQLFNQQNLLVVVIDNLNESISQPRDLHPLLDLSDEKDRVDMATDVVEETNDEF